MMSDPERMIESGSVDPEVRELLQSLRNVSPEPGTGEKSWGVMAAKIAALPVLATASKSAAQVGAIQGNLVAAGAAKAIAVKVAAGVLATTLLGAGIVVLRAEHAAPPSGVKPVPAATTLPAALVGPPAEPTTASPAAPTPPMEKPLVPASPGGAATRRSQLDAEASLLAKVRGELRSGNARAAEAGLFQLQSAFPRGQLGQERDVLAVEVLAANGNMAAAKRKARAFIAAHPTSPHSAKLERLVGER